MLHAMAMTSVETSVKPPPHPELPTLSIKGVDIGTDSSQSTKSSATNDTENEDEIRRKWCW